MKRRGLTMLEILFAMTLLFVVSVFIMSMFATGARQAAQATQNSDLVALTRTKTSEVRAVPFDDLATLVASGPFPAPYDSYTYQLSFADFAGRDPAEVQIVTITVSHPDYGTRVMRTVRSKVPLTDPGEIAWNKFGCATCHAIPTAGYPDDGYLVVLEEIGTVGAPRPSGSVAAYIDDSIRDPMGFDAFGGTEGVMMDFMIEGEPGYDPNTGISNQEVSDLANWIATFTSTSSFP